MRLWITGFFVVVLISSSAAWWENGLSFDFLSPWFEHGDGIRTKDDDTSEPDFAGDEDPNDQSSEKMEHTINSIERENESDATEKPSDSDTKAISAKLENGKVQTYRLKLKLNELMEYNEHIERFENKLDMCIEKERTHKTSAPWWPTEEYPDTEAPSEEETDRPWRTRWPRQPTTPPYYLVGSDYYVDSHSFENHK